MNNEKDETIYNVPLWEKVMLTIDEAAAYTGVGSRKIRQLTDNERCPFVLWNGSKRLIKREEFVVSNPVKKERLEVPIWHKPYLTIDEATAYTGIGREKLREMTRFADCPFVLWVGKRRMIKRELFDEYIEKMYEI